jgi:hypothetical protein
MAEETEAVVAAVVVKAVVVVAAAVVAVEISIRRNFSNG